MYAIKRWTVYRWEVFAELSSSPSCAFEAFVLESEPSIRRQRSSGGAGGVLEPQDPSTEELPIWLRRISNSEEGRAKNIASEIHQAVIAREVLPRELRAEVPGVLSEIRDFGTGASQREAYWNQVYSTQPGLLKPSSFALWFSEQLGDYRATGILDFGCGNGRDSAFLSDLAPVVGVDASESAIALCRRTWGTGPGQPRLSFIVGNHRSLSYLLRAHEANVFYSRFVWHSMTQEEESSVVGALQASLAPGGVLAIEARTIQDPLAARGAKISTTERVAGHYRRFVDVDSLVDQLRTAGFQVQQIVQGRGLAVLGGDDPDVVRILARKQ